MAVYRPLAHRSASDIPVGFAITLSDIRRHLRERLSEQDTEAACRLAVLLAAGRTQAAAAQELGFTRAELEWRRQCLRCAVELSRAE